MVVADNVQYTDILCGRICAGVLPCAVGQYRLDCKMRAGQSISGSGVLVRELRALVLTEAIARQWAAITQAQQNDFSLD